MDETTPELTALIRQVRAIRGPDAVVEANLRASAAALASTDVTDPDWLLTFQAAWTHELRRLLSPRASAS